MLQELKLILDGRHPKNKITDKNVYARHKSYSKPCSFFNQNFVDYLAEWQHQGE
jgi:hypothetical protein